MAGPIVALTVELPRISVRCIAGRPLTVRVPSLTGAGAPMPAAATLAARAHVRQHADDPGVLHVFDTAESTVAITDGWLTFTATSDVTGGWAQLWPGSAPETVAVWDIEITDSDSIRWQITEPAPFVVVHQVTR